MNMKNLLATNVLIWLCDVLEAQLKSAEEEMRRLVESVLVAVGG